MAKIVRTIANKWNQMGKNNPDFNILKSTFLIFLGLFILMALGSRAFLTPRNISNILTQSAMYVIMGVGMTFVLTTGGIDISVGSIVGIATAVIGDVIVNQGMPVWLGFIAGLGAGLLCGMFNAAFITFLKIPPIIVTLGTWTMFRGLAYVYLGGTIYYNFPPVFIAIARGRFLGLPIPVWIAAVVFIWGHYFLTRTKTGRQITALGGNEEAARLAGINTKRLRFFVYSLMGLLVGLASIIVTARLDSASAGTGGGFEMHTIASVVVGGTSLFGGRGLMFGTLLGVLMLGIVENGLLLAGISFFWQRVLLGFIFVSVVGFRTFREKS
jgi:ribose transport system permease protein